MTEAERKGQRVRNDVAGFEKLDRHRPMAFPRVAHVLLWITGFRHFCQPAGIRYSVNAYETCMSACARECIIIFTIAPPPSLWTGERSVLLRDIVMVCYLLGRNKYLFMPHWLLSQLHQRLR